MNTQRTTDSMAPVRLVQITTHPIALVFLMRGQLRYLQERGFEVHAISSPGDELATYAASEGVKTCAVDMPRRITPVHDIAAVRRVMRVLRQVRPHIVHANTPKGGLLGVIAGRLTRTPVCIYHMRGLPYMSATGGGARCSRRRSGSRAGSRIGSSA